VDSLNFMPANKDRVSEKSIRYARAASNLIVKNTKSHTSRKVGQHSIRNLSCGCSGAQKLLVWFEVHEFAGVHDAVRVEHPFQSD
jgi:hypothetical protein